MEHTVCGRNLINCDLNESFVRQRQVNVERTGGDSEDDNTSVLSGRACKMGGGFKGI
jgi:hypothetical protein